MAAQIKLFHRLFWLLDTVYSAKQISLSQIDKRWEQSHYNDKQEREYGKRNLHRHREDIAELFGIEIVCDRTPSSLRRTASKCADVGGISSANPLTILRKTNPASMPSTE